MHYFVLLRSVNLLQFSNNVDRFYSRDFDSFYQFFNFNLVAARNFAALPLIYLCRYLNTLRVFKCDFRLGIYDIRTFFWHKINYSRIN